MNLDDLSRAPNPQFARIPFHDLIGEWEFSFDDDERGIADRWFLPDSTFDRTITVPFPPESRMSGVHDTSYHRIFWYKRAFVDPRKVETECLLVRFGAVDYEATVWVDGVFVGSHEGGSTPFSFDITAALDPTRQDHVLIVKAMDDPTDLEQPRGKQSWTPQPEHIHYHRTSGIWQPVWLEVTPRIRIEDIRWTFDRASWSLGFEMSLNLPALPGNELAISLADGDQHVASGTWSVKGRQYRGRLDLRNSRSPGDLLNLLWSPSRPILIGARVSLSAPGQPTDIVSSYIGLRTVSTDHRKILINGEPTFLRMVLNQGYWPESHLAAPSSEALRREVELILNLGFNGARLHQKAEDPRFLFWADSLGLMLWAEMGSSFTYSDKAIRMHAQEWSEVVLRDRNHPSIITWVPFNESWGVDDVALNANERHAVKAAYYSTHQLDGSRPVVGNDGWENVIGDILTAHDYNWNPAHLEKLYGSSTTVDDLVASYALKFRRLVVGDYGPTEKPVILSEFGGVSFAPETGDRWFGYGTVRSSDEFVATYKSLVDVISQSTQLAGFCYTQLTDTLQETNGLVTEDRVPKADVAVIRDITIGLHAPRIGAWQQDGATTPDTD